MSTRQKRPRLLEQPRAKSSAHFSIKEKQNYLTTSPADFQVSGLTFTSVPVGLTWSVRIYNSDCDVRLGNFDGRAGAMTAATQLASMLGGEVHP